MLSLALTWMLATGTIRQTQANLEARVRANGGDASAHYSLCRTYYSLENWDGAIAECEQAVKISDASEYHNWLARAYGAKAEHSPWLQAIPLAKKAHTEFEKAVQADPKNAVARRDLADYYIDAPAMLGGGKNKAEQQAAALDSISRPAALYVRARLAESNKDNAKAEDFYKQAVAAAHNPADYLNELAGFYRRTGNLDQMQATIARVAAMPQPGIAFYDTACMLIRTGRNLNGAIEMLQRYIASGGTEEAPLHQAYYQLGLAYQKRGDKSAAQDQFKQALESADYRPAEKALGRDR
jgi:tetratricopeptide (TPR) repeat protein